MGADRQELLDVWAAVLTNDRDIDPADAVVDELADYFQVPQDEARKRCVDFERRSTVEWNEVDRSTPDGLIEFWNRNTPIFGILMSHALQYTEEHPAVCVDIIEVLADRGIEPGRLLDYGVGPATSSMFFERLGWTVTGADVAQTMLDFASWRAERRASTCTFLNLQDTTPPKEAFDVVVALEVMAHVPDIPATLAEMRSALTGGGILIFNVYAPPNQPEGHLFVGNYHVIRHVQASGFRLVQRIGKYYMYEKVELTPWQRRAILVKDNLRHNRIVSDAAQIVRRLLARVR